MLFRRGRLSVSSKQGDVTPRIANALVHIEPEENFCPPL